MARAASADCRDGRPRGVRAIGHLFEAEDEAQQWPELHAAIREAGRAYQAEGSLPDWEALAEAVVGMAAVKA